jgi:hypothetical protein
VAFARRGCSVVLMSEHSRGFSAAKWQEYVEACAKASTAQVTLVPGIEYGDSDNVVHIPVWGTVPFFGSAPGIGELLTEATEAGGTAVLAHPWRRDAWRRVEPQWRQYLTGVEVWNRKYDGVAPNPHAFELSDQWQVSPFAALDFHTRRQFFPLSLALELIESAGAAPGPVSVDNVYAALASERFAPHALGIPLSRLRSGLPAAALRTLEAGRRTAARMVR